MRRWVGGLLAGTLLSIGIAGCGTTQATPPTWTLEVLSFTNTRHGPVKLTKNVGWWGPVTVDTTTGKDQALMNLWAKPFVDMPKELGNQLSGIPGPVVLNPVYHQTALPNNWTELAMMLQLYTPSSFLNSTLWTTSTGLVVQLRYKGAVVLACSAASKTPTPGHGVNGAHIMFYFRLVGGRLEWHLYSGNGAECMRVR